MDEFIRALLEQVRCKKARAGIAREITDHIEDAAQDLEQEGMTHEQALAAAVQSMGDPVAIGVELDRIHRPRMDWRTFIMIVILNLDNDSSISICILGSTIRRAGWHVSLGKW